MSTISRSEPDFAPELCHNPLMKNAPRSLSFDPSKDFIEWKREVGKKLRELLGTEPPRTPLNIRREPQIDHPNMTETRFVFTAEENADVPCHLLIPKTGEAPYPVVICLQGHSPGMHISLGRAKNESEAASISGGRDFAIQAVEQGYAAIALEQRCFGEREDRRPDDIRHVPRRCFNPSLVALLLGRTMIGERALDVSRAIDALAEFPEIDANRIACMGNSGGGTVTYYAACVEPRISVAMPSCSVCTFEGSIGSIDHCECNFVPGILRWFEMGDLSALIAPRPLIVVTGRHDSIFPLAEVEKTYDSISRIYDAAGAPDKCRLVIGDGGHQFYPDDAWPAFKEFSGW